MITRILAVCVALLLLGGITHAADLDPPQTTIELAIDAPVVEAVPSIEPSVVTPVRHATTLAMPPPCAPLAAPVAAPMDRPPRT